MRLDLREIINMPGAHVDFDYFLELPEDGLPFPSVCGIVEAPRAVGAVRNSAGVLRLEGRLTARLSCVCDRCLEPFERPVDLEVSAVLAERVEDEENSDIYLLQGDLADLDEVFLTELVFSLEGQFLCGEDCAGLCPDCGKNLNEGPCQCGPQKDPRLAVLEQLLMDNNE